MITGFNTDVEHDGVVYHVQTEDKGLETPFILSLVYVGGAILASKRSPYTDLLGDKFDAAALNERLQRQHKLICAAITAGRIEDLKRLSGGDTVEMAAAATRAKRPRRKSDAAASPQEVPAAAATPPGEHVPDVRALERHGAEAPAPGAEATPAAKSKTPAPKVREEAAALNAAKAARETGGAAAGVDVPLPVEAVVVAGEADGQQARAAALRAAPPMEKSPEDPILVEIDGALHVNLLEERDYRAGEIVTLRVRVSRGPIESREAVSDAAVTVKVLGTEFRPLILTSKTDADGVAVIHAWLPRFTSGRAAILVRASSDGYTAELRRAVRHS